MNNDKPNIDIRWDWTPVLVTAIGGLFFLLTVTWSIQIYTKYRYDETKMILESASRVRVP